MEVPGMDYEQESISFSRNEWQHLLDEIEMRGVGKISQCINNARYLAMLDRSDEQAKNGEGIIFTEKGWDDYNFWLETEGNTFDRINNMIRKVKSKIALGAKIQSEKLHEEGNIYHLKIDEDNDFIYIAGAKNFTITSCLGHY